MVAALKVLLLVPNREQLVFLYSTVTDVTMDAPRQGAS